MKLECPSISEYTKGQRKLVIVKPEELIYNSCMNRNGFDFSEPLR